ncbi:MAG: YhcH/YjgK/YiaL family protein [Verrucomicrobia bacterium]|jgi:biofilm protein TabA|nr:YhcH/YjgK/YiaL family protein [Verrucomicrobiota bacterium]
MIIDELSNRGQYPYGDAWTTAFRFLHTLNADTPEGQHALQGELIYAAIERYNTKPREGALPEAHRRYVDIQMLLSGSERIEWWPTRTLKTVQPYVPDRDIAFYAQPDHPGISVELKPGRFALFFPEDAHMPGLHAATDSSPVKKVVIKIDATLLSGG